MERTQEPPIHKTIPYVVLISIVLIVALILGGKWEQARRQKLDAERASQSISSQATETIAYSYIFDKLNDLPEGLSYQVWVGDDQNKSSFMTFYTKNGEAIDTDNKPFDEFKLPKASKEIEIHIYSEEKNDSIAFLHGSLTDNTTELKLIPQFTEISGSFILATPTTATTNDEFDGVHFVNTDLTSSSLTLPVLQSDWRYSALMRNNLTKKTYFMGTFTNPDSADNYSQLSGEGKDYPFPGEDFICLERLTIQIPASCTSLSVNTGDFTVQVGITSEFLESQILIPLLEATIPESDSVNEIEMNVIFVEPRIVIVKKET